MFRSFKYVAVFLLVAWLILSLFSRERRRNIEAGLQRTAYAISITFMAFGFLMLYRAVTGDGATLSQATLMILIGFGMLLYQIWGT